MRKQWIVVLLMFGLLGLGACSSSDEKSESGDQAADAEALDSGDAAASSDGEEKKSDEVNADFGDEQPPADGAAPPADTPPADGTAVAESTPEPVPDAPPPTDTGSAMPPPVEDTPPSEPPPPRPVASLKKIKDRPFTENGHLLNSVYVGRPGDTWKSVSEKIYGTPGKQKVLKGDNPAIGSRKMKVGDKVYYNSPLRSTDDTVVKTYYEDKGIEPQSYVAQEGDNLKAVGKTLLGNKDSWKELWVTNLDLESKGALAAGTTVKYWPEGSDAAPPTTDVNAATGAPPPGGAPPPTDIPPPPPPPTDIAGGVPPPPPPPTDVLPPPPVAGNVEPPPPPPPTDIPPPVEPPKPKKKFTARSDEGGMDQDTTMALGASAILILAGAGLFLIVRKSRAKKLKLGQTQV